MFEIKAVQYDKQYALVKFKQYFNEMTAPSIWNPPIPKKLPSGSAEFTGFVGKGYALGSINHDANSLTLKKLQRTHKSQKVVSETLETIEVLLETEIETIVDLYVGDHPVGERCYSIDKTKLETLWNSVSWRNLT